MRSVPLGFVRNGASQLTDPNQNKRPVSIARRLGSRSFPFRDVSSCCSPSKQCSRHYRNFSVDFLKFIKAAKFVKNCVESTQTSVLKWSFDSRFFVKISYSIFICVQAGGPPLLCCPDVYICMPLGRPVAALAQPAAVPSPGGRGGMGWHDCCTIYFGQE